MRHLLISEALLLSVLFTFTSAKTYYVTPMASTPCPEEGVPCFTLSQYANKPKHYFVPNTSLILIPGNHSLDAQFVMVDLKSLSIIGNTTTNYDTSITCTQSSMLIFLKNIGVVSMRGLMLIGCMNNNITSVKQFTLENCSLQGQGRNGTALEFNNITNASIVKTSFSSYTGKITLVPDHHFLVGVGGAIIIMNSKFEIFSSKFTNNTVTQNLEYGGAVFAYSSNVTIKSNTFSSNSAIGNNAHGGAVCVKYSNVTMNDNTFNNNSVIGYAPWGGAAYVYSSHVIMNSNTFNSNTAIGYDGRGGAVFVFETEVTMNNNTFINNLMTGKDGALKAMEGGAVCAWYSPVTMINNTFKNNTILGNSASVGGAVCVLYSSVTMINSMFKNNGIIGSNALPCGLGGAVYVYLVSNMTMKSNTFNSNSAKLGVVYAIQSTMNFSRNTTISNNYGSIYAYACNVTFMGHTNIMNNSYSANTSQEGGAVTAIQSKIFFTGAVNLSYNKAVYGGAISVTQTKLFVGANITITHNIASFSGGGIHAYQSELNLEGHINISNNSAVERGGGIHVISSITRMKDYSKTYLVGNYAKRGGGACLEMDTKLYVINKEFECYKTNNSDCWPDDTTNLESWIRLEFNENSAVYGGALYITDDTNSGTCHATPFSGEYIIFSECFIQIWSLKSNIYQLSNINIRHTFFTNNSAKKAGDVIYGGLLDRCTLRPSSEYFVKYKNASKFSVVSYILNVTNLDFNDLSRMISSDPVRVCFCRDDKPDCSYQPPPVYVRKGETFTVSLVAVDQINNTISNSTIHGSVPLHASLGEEQSAQKTNENRTCTDLNYTIFSSHNSGELSLYAEGPCMGIGISKANIKIYIEPCPIGFEDINQRCDCDRILNKYVSKCFIDGQTVLREDNVWFSYVNTTDHPHSYILHKHCPLDYCCPPTESVLVNLTILNGADAMCANNRRSKLCGSCKDGLSLSLGSSRCMLCSNKWLALLIVFAIAGVALVAFVLVCNLTVAVGTINGLIFYANIIAANRSIFLPFSKPNILTIFIAWLNLDFGFETCFYNGMDGYTKTWLQLAFPLYIISLVIAIIVISDYSKKFAALFTKGKDPIATLATLILLSYTKFIRSIIAALSLTSLEYSNDSTESSVIELVWLTDANVPYLKGKHIPLFISALVIVIIAMAYVLLLFGWQWINMLCPNMWITKNAKLNIFMNTYHNPYNKEHRYWIGLLLLVRVLLYLVSAVNVLGDPNINLISIISAIVVLFVVQLYPGHKITKRKLIFTTDNIALLNLISFTIIILTLTEERKSKAVVAYISTSFSLITFLFILIYHTCMFVLKKPLETITACFTRTDFPTIQPSNPTPPYDSALEKRSVTVTVVDAPKRFDTLSDEDHKSESDEDEENKPSSIERNTKPDNKDTIHNIHSNISCKHLQATKTAENNYHVSEHCKEISDKSIDKQMPVLACVVEPNLCTLTPVVTFSGENGGDTLENETTPLLAPGSHTERVKRNYKT